MELFEAVCEFWLDQVVWILRFGIVFGLLAYFMPCNRGMRWWAAPRAMAADFFYWFAVPFALRNVHRVLVVGTLTALFGEDGGGLLPLADWPLWTQCLAILVIQDVLLYGLHRGFHTRWAWRFHAVHHSPAQLDWPAAARFHPVNHALTFVVADLAVLLLGFSPLALAVLLPFNLWYSTMVHANLNWTFGPLRYVFASPVFHRWHHTTQAAGRDKNFASTFPILDVLFGTFYMPRGELPAEFGSDDPDFPQGFWGQLAYPFRRPKPVPAASPAADPPQRRQAA
jgi:sterol desaturase/sphingolipid hydroxylase (fatty acid hydroxylase superfamily)